MVLYKIESRIYFIVTKYEILVHLIHSAKLLTVITAPYIIIEKMLKEIWREG